MSWQEIDRYIRSLGIRCDERAPGQTSAGVHSTTSWHYHGLAVDYGLADSDADAIARALEPFAQGPDAPLVELFGSVPGLHYKNGVYTGVDPTGGHENNHTHAAIRRGAALPREEDEMKDDERSALMFTAEFLQELKQRGWFVGEILGRLEQLNTRVATLESQR